MEFKRHYFDRNVIETIRMAVVIVTVFSCINLAHYYMNLKSFRENMVNTTLEEATDYISRTLQDVNGMYAHTSQLLAELYAYKIEQGYSNSDMLRELQEKKQTLSVKNVGLVDLTNNLYLDSFNQELTIDINSSRDQWVQEFLDIPEDYQYYFYDPDEAEYEPLYSFFHNYKIKNANGDVIGITGVGIDFDTFYNRVKGLNENITVSFLTKEGEIRLPKSDKGQSVFAHFPNLSKQQFLLTENEDQILWQLDSQESYLLYAHYLENIHRVLLLKIDVTDYYNQSKQQHFYSFLVGVGLTIIVVILNLLNSLYQANKLKRTAFYDPLTRCHNRHYLESHIKTNLYWYKIRHAGYAMIVFDIDHFKRVNDTLGHLAGDQVLKQVADIVKRSLRDTDEFIRWGGDEFVILLDMKAEEAISIADRIQQHIAKESDISLSIGITDISEQDSFKSAMDRADAALYEAKHQGRNQIKTRWLHAHS